MVSSVLSAHRWDTRDMVLFALFTALIAIGAFIRSPATSSATAAAWPSELMAAPSGSHRAPAAAAAPPRWPSTSS